MFVDSFVAIYFIKRSSQFYQLGFLMIWQKCQLPYLYYFKKIFTGVSCLKLPIHEWVSQWYFWDSRAQTGKDYHAKTLNHPWPFAKQTADKKVWFFLLIQENNLRTLFIAQWEGIFLWRQRIILSRPWSKSTLIILAKQHIIILARLSISSLKPKRPSIIFTYNIHLGPSTLNTNELGKPF